MNEQLSKICKQYHRKWHLLMCWTTTKMFCKEINDVARDILNDNIIRLVAAGVIFVSIVVAIFIRYLLMLFYFLNFFRSFLAGAIILFNYVVGVIVCFSLLKYQKHASVYLQRVASFYKGHISPRKESNRSCTVCSNSFCNRHEPVLLKQPWKKLHIKRNLNLSIEHVSLFFARNLAAVRVF